MSCEAAPFLVLQLETAGFCWAGFFSFRLTGTSDLLGSLPTNLGYRGQKKIPETYQCVVSHILRSRLSLLFSVFLSESWYVYCMCSVQGWGLYLVKGRGKSTSAPSSQMSIPHFLCKGKLKNIPQHWFSEDEAQGITTDLFLNNNHFTDQQDERVLGQGCK